MFFTSLLDFIIFRIISDECRILQPTEGRLVNKVSYIYTSISWINFTTKLLLGTYAHGVTQIPCRSTLYSSEFCNLWVTALKVKYASKIVEHYFFRLHKNFFFFSFFFLDFEANLLEVKYICIFDVLSGFALHIYDR